MSNFDALPHSVLFLNEDKFEIQQSCYFEIEVGINSESIRNGTIFEIIKEILIFTLHWGYN